MNDFVNLQEISTEDIVAELIRRKAVVPNNDIYLILDNSGYFAFKLWTAEDVASVLEAKLDCSANPGLVAEVLNDEWLGELSECDDGEWQVIDDAVCCCMTKWESKLNDAALTNFSLADISHSMDRTKLDFNGTVDILAAYNRGTGNVDDILDMWENDNKAD